MCDFVWLRWPLKFLPGCSGLLRLSLFKRQFVEADGGMLGASVASRGSFGLQWPLEIVWLAHRWGCSFIIALSVGEVVVCFLKMFR